MSQNQGEVAYTSDLMIAGATLLNEADGQAVPRRGFGAIFSDCGNPRVALGLAVEAEESVQTAEGNAAAAPPRAELSGIGYTAMGNQYMNLIGAEVPNMQRVREFELKDGRPAEAIVKAWAESRNLPFKMVQDAEFGPPGSTQFVYHCEVTPLLFGKAMRGNKKQAMEKAARIALSSLLAAECILIDGV